MTVEILVPPLSQTNDSLILVEWIKKVGDSVNKGETLFTVETDKATLEVESPATGILKTALAASGDEIKVRAVIGLIAEPGDEFDAHPGSTHLRETGEPSKGGFLDPSAEPAASAMGIAGSKIDDLPIERRQRIFATPRARNLVQRNNLDLEDFRGSGTGPHQWIIARDITAYLERKEEIPRATPLAARMAEAAGIDLASIAPERSGTSITKADVEEAIQKRDEELVMSPSTKVTRLSPTRKTIARHLQESHATTVPVTYMSEVDATRLLKLRRRILKELPEDSTRPTVTDLFIRLACLVLPRHPHMNAILVGDQLEVFTAVHMGLAVDTPRGLIVPVIRDAQDKGLLELARTRRELVERTVNEKLGPEELSGGTFTITNLGTMGVDFFTPVINSPQVAILGIGRIREIPVVRKRKVKIRQVIGLSITCDHRLIDGAPAARFLKDLADWVEEPDRIWL